VKAQGIGGAVAQLAWASRARDRLAIYAFDPAEIRAAKAAVPELPCVLLLYLEADPGGVLATIDACGADGADVPWQWNATSLLGQMRERGLLIGGGSAHGGEAAERLIALGTDMIDTDAPAVMLTAVRKLSVSASGH
jgi:hypothetical protein